MSGDPFDVIVRIAKSRVIAVVFVSRFVLKGSRSGGDPRVTRELRELIRQMSKDNPLWGAPTHPWRVAKTRVRTRSVDGIQVHDPMPRTVAADLADVPAQPCRCHCGDRPMRCADPDIRTFACAPRHRSQPTTEWLAQQTVEAFPWVQCEGDPRRRVATEIPTRREKEALAMSGKQGTCVVARRAQRLVGRLLTLCFPRVTATRTRRGSAVQVNGFGSALFCATKRRGGRLDPTGSALLFCSSKRWVRRSISSAS